MAEQAFPVVDSDSHVFEPAALWDSYVPSGFEGLARSALWHFEDAGRRLTVLNGRPAKEMNRSAINRQAIWRPGMSLDDIGALDPSIPHGINPGASDASARLADMDALGIDQAIVYPTLFLEYHPLVEDTIAADVLARAYNDWVADFAAAGNGRLHPVAVLPLQSLPLAQRELDRVAANGFRAAALRPMFYSGAFIEGDHFQPLWRQLEELGVVACVHPSVGVTNPEPTSAGAHAERVSERLRIGHSVAEAVAGIQDAGVFLTAATFHGLLEDFPNLKLALGHSGATMVPLVLEKAETYLWLGQRVRALRSGEPRARGGLPRAPGAHVVRLVGDAGGAHARCVRRHRGVGIAISEPRHRYARRGDRHAPRARCRRRDDRPTDGRQRNRTVRPQGFRFCVERREEESERLRAGYPGS